MLRKYRVFEISHNGQFEYVSLTLDRLQESVEVLKNSFFPHENVCKMVGLADCPEAIAAYEESVIDIARNGVSVIAVDQISDKVVGVSLNVIQNKDTWYKELLDEYNKYVKYPQIQAFTQVAIQIEGSVNPFTLYNTDCLMEILFLGVPPSYSNNGIGFMLTAASIKLASLLYKGENAKTSLDNSDLPLDPRPQIVTSIFTNYKTQQISKKLGFTVLKSMSYDDLLHKNISVLGCENGKLTYECKKLE